MVNYRQPSATATSPGQSPLMKPVQFLMLYHTDMVGSSVSFSTSHTGLVPSPLHRPVRRRDQRLEAFGGVNGGRVGGLGVKEYRELGD